MDQRQVIENEVEDYLLKHASSTKVFFKTKEVAGGLKAGTVRVGSAIGRLKNKTDKLKITRWGMAANNITWKVEVLEAS